jgi:hypothetical protein
MALATAQKHGVDLLLMVDSDIAPDVEKGKDPNAQPFWKSTIDFMLEHEGPCVVAAPYCGPPPVENIYVFQWTKKQGDHPDPDGEIVQYTREQAAVMGGIHEAAALPTGLLLLDMRALKLLTPPYTYYEWEGDGPACQGCGLRKPGPQSAKASTEDVTFTRDLSLAGVKVYCNWDAWCGHVKRKVVGKPRPYAADAVAERMKEAILSRRASGDRLIDVKAKGSRFEADIKKALAAAEAAEAAGRSEWVAEYVDQHGHPPPAEPLLRQAAIPQQPGTEPVLFGTPLTFADVVGEFDPLPPVV